jgi:hypothetical protein
MSPRTSLKVAAACLLGIVAVAGLVSAIFVPVGRAMEHALHVLDSIPRRLWSVAMATALSVGAMRLFARWIRESRAAPRPLPGAHAQLGSLGKLAEQLRRAPSIWFEHEKILLMIRALAVEVVSVERGIRENEAHELVVKGEWTRDPILLHWTSLETLRNLARAHPRQRSTFSRESLEEFLTRLPNFSRPQTFPGEGETDGR